PGAAAPPPTAPGVAPGATPGPAPAPSAAQPPVGIPGQPDLLNQGDLNMLRGRAQNMLADLVSTLPAPQQQRVQGIPLVVDNTVGEVNAFATCAGSRAAMAITDGLLEIQAELSQARAIDELFGTRKVDEYIHFLAQNERPKKPIPRPPAGFF